MGVCGQICQPTEIFRHIESFPSSTRPAKVSTDAGDGYIKGVSNPEGTRALISEFVAAELAAWFDLQIPPFAVIANCEIDIPMMGLGASITPPVFFSKAVDGQPRDGGVTFLKKLKEPDDVSRLIFFDTWIRNFDRYMADRGHENSENLLYVRSETGRNRYDLVPIDHTHCFVTSSFSDPIDWTTNAIDERVYGEFPEFSGFITEAGIESAVQRLYELNYDIVLDIINSIPRQWGFNANVAEPFAEFICTRATFVVNTLPFKLLTQANLPNV